MAKKGQQAQLQIEVNNDDEWEKLLQKEGLIIVDVYSDWCGPCLGMQANLKKIKLESGGDMLQLAVAKSDGITALKRFRNKSEPTWLFISKGKMINLMFGADAPKLTRLILDELKKEQAQQQGQATDRTPMDVTELAEEEKVRYDAAESIEKAIREKEERKRTKELLERRTQECENILTNLPNYGTALIFPCAKDKYKLILNEILDEAGLLINQTEKVNLTEDMINELCYFTDVTEEFSEESLEQLYNNEAIMVLFKIASRAEIEDIDDAILTMIYGHTKKPPGVQDSVAQKLVHVEEEEEEKDKEKDKEKEKANKNVVGIWVPPTPEVRATALRMFFPKVSSDFTIPEPPPEPEHVAIIFPVDRKDEVTPIVHEFPNEIMKHGIFTSEDIEAPKLVTPTFKALEKLLPSQRTYSEKLVMQVSKQRSECILAFAQINPIYMSPNAKEGKIQCEKFFPEEYKEENEEEEEVIEESHAVDDGEGGKENEDTDESELKVDETGEEAATEEERCEPKEENPNESGDIGEALPVEGPIVKVNDDMLEELLFFSETKFPLKTIEDLGNNKLSFALLFKRSNEHLTGNIDDVVLQMVYGNTRKPPGDEKSPFLKLKKVWNDSGKYKDWLDVKDKLPEEELAEIEDKILLGIWPPPDSLSKAMMLKHLFPNLSNPFKMPDLKAVPLHVAVAYDAFKAKDVFELSDKYPDKVMSFGYFSSDLPGEAKLLGKTTEKFEARGVSLTYEEKLIIQLAKDDPESFVDFMDLGPSYISTDAEVGQLDCLYFFPAGYNTPEAEIITYLKKKTKRKGKLGKFKPTPDQILQEGDAQSVVAGTEIDTSIMDLTGEEATVIGDDANNGELDSEDEEGENGDKGEEEDNQNEPPALENADKATSPVAET